MNRQKTASPWWVVLLVWLGTFLSAAGALIALLRPAMLAGPDAALSPAAHIFAGYFAARSFVLACFLGVLFAIRAHRVLGQVLTIVGVIQLADAVMDCMEGRWPVVPGVIVLGVLFLLAAARLCGHPFWRREAWAE